MMLYGILIYAIILILYGLYIEIRFRNRYRINYSSYLKYLKYYEIRINKVYLSCVIIFIILSTLYLYALISDIEGYLIIVIVMLNLYQLTFVLLHITSLKYRKELSQYSKYHSIIKESLDNKEQVLTQINYFTNTLNSMTDKNYEINREFSGYFSNFTGINNLDDTLEPLKNVLSLYQENLKCFDPGIINDFDYSLKMYINTGIINSLTINEFKLIKQDEFDYVIDKTENMRKVYIYRYTLEKLKAKEVLSLEHLLDLIKNLEIYKIAITDEMVMEILNYSFNFAKKKKMVELLAGKKLITIDVLCNYVNAKDLSWVYEMPLENFINKNDCLPVFKTIINNNAQNCAFKILTNIDFTYLSYLKQAINEVGINNQTKNMFITVREILGSSNYGNEATRYENIAVALSEYFDEYDKEDINNRNIKEIIAKQTFAENAHYLESIYERVNKDNFNMFHSLVNTLLVFSMLPENKIDFIKHDEVVKLFWEYRKNLNIKEIKLLQLLLKTLILLNEDDESKIAVLYPDFDEALKNAGGKQTKNLSRMEKVRYIVKSNIKYLTGKNNINTFKKIVNRIEKTRLVLDKIVNL